jgi:hypothetical protein
MRTTITGQLQAVQNDREQQVQRLLSSSAMLSGSSSPKLLALDRTSSFDRRELDAISQNLSDLDGK